MGQRNFNRGGKGKNGADDELRSPDRITRVNEILKREIADLLERENFNEGGKLISVTRVDCSTTLKQAKVYISMFGTKDEERPAILKRLVQLRGEVQSKLSKHVILKYTPILEFIDDRNIEEGDRILQILRDLEQTEKLN